MTFMNNAELLEKIERVRADKKANRYSTSLIYEVHNYIMKRNERPQRCATCLASRAKAIEKWALVNAHKLEKDYKEPTTEIVDGAEFHKVGSEGLDLTNPHLTKEERDAMLGYAPLDPDGYEYLDVVDAEGLQLTVQYDPVNQVAYNSVTGELMDAGEFTLEDARLMSVGIDGAVVFLDIDPTGTDAPAEGDSPLEETPEGSTEVQGEPIELEDGVTVYLLDGVAQDAEGKKLRAGSYVMANGDTLAVQVGGKATIKEDIL